VILLRLLTDRITPLVHDTVHRNVTLICLLVRHEAAVVRPPEPVGAVELLLRIIVSQAVGDTGLGRCRGELVLDDTFRPFTTPGDFTKEQSAVLDKAKPFTVRADLRVNDSTVSDLH
jgi:hypothetical protein